MRFDNRARQGENRFAVPLYSGAAPFARADDICRVARATGGGSKKISPSSGQKD